ncbi:efflux RND transporter periplasmic adaptor subunit [Thiohalocapsa marina]|uniref:efflux RND transporter periplasmic adaptor subunit n=1 Tax=Thiohalocapsa marina TaxID=424902 RepID=UPI0036D7B07F
MHDLNGDDDLARLLETERQASVRRRRLRWLLVPLLLALGGLAWLLLAPRTNDAPRYETEPVQRGRLVVQVTATGTLQPVNQVEVGTEVSGTIESVAVDYNDRVSAGDVLAQLDTDQLDARLRQSQAALALADARVLEARATVTETGNRLRRTSELIAKKLASPEEMDTASAAFERAQALLAVAKAQVDQAQAQVDADQRAVEKAVIRSPIDGIVLERKVEPGQTVAASLQTPVLFTLAENLAQMELHVDVDEADVGQVAEGQAAEFRVDAYPERSFPAHIEQVRFAPSTTEGVVTYETLLSVDNAHLLLRPGMTATAEILVEQLEDVLLVPSAALRFRPPSTDGTGRSGGGLVGMLLPRPPHGDRRAADSAAKARVWVLRAGAPTPIPVETGASDGTWTQITAGALEPGMAVLTDVLERGG